MNLQATRENLLRDWARVISTNALRGKLSSNGKPIQIAQARTIAGPRAGVVRFRCNDLDGGRLYRALSKNERASLAEQCPFDPARNIVSCEMAGRWVQVEAGWPSGLAVTKIPLAALPDKPSGQGRWIVGQSETGATVVAGFDNNTAMFLLAGATGSGKSVALQSAILQLSADPDNHIVLADGKRGESLKALERLPGVVGPTATDLGTIRGALCWTVKEMLRRYETGDRRGRVVLVYDEFQTGTDDKAIVKMLHTITSQGRAALVFGAMATQHPDLACFGDPKTRRNLTGKIALRVEDPDASRVAIGAANPRADFLLGAGDCYVLGPGKRHRVQGAYVDQNDIDRVMERANGRAGHWDVTDWESFYDPSVVSQEVAGSNTGGVAFEVSGAEFAVSLVAASESAGRPTLKRMLEDAGLGKPGSTRAQKLLELGRDAFVWLDREGYAIAQPVAA